MSLSDGAWLNCNGRGADWTREAEIFAYFVLQFFATPKRIELSWVSATTKSLPIQRIMAPLGQCTISWPVHYVSQSVASDNRE